MRRVLNCLAVTAAFICTAHVEAMELLFTLDKPFTRPAQESPNPWDLDGDGCQELCVGAEDQDLPLEVYSGTGDLIWRYEPDATALCGDCDNPISRYFLVGFGDVDRSQGREAIIYWICYGDGGVRNGVAVLGLPDSNVLHSLRSPVDTGDPGWHVLIANLDDIHGDELAVEFPGQPIQVWGYRTVTESPLASTEHPARIRVLRNGTPRPVMELVGTWMPAERIRVVEASGRHIRTLAVSSSNHGKHIIEWDGRDDGGREAPSGVYFVTADGAPKDRMVKLVVVR